MMRFCYLILCSLLVVNISDAQFSKSCASHKHFDQKLKSNQELNLSFDKLQDQISAYLSQSNKEQDGDVIIIPTVFHIIHNGDDIGVQENISESLILAQLQQLNDDFSRMNADAVDTPDAFKSIAANIQIQFCLAQVDQTGGPTSGILRTHIDNLPNVNEADCWTPTYIDDNIVSPLIWDRNSYLNIFSVIGIDDLNGGTCDFFSTLGYAQFPGGPASTDAAIVSFYTFGSLQMPNPLFPNYTGRTCTHEVGHWLNLSHVWGGGSGGCGQDDGISDTPLQFEETNGCPTFPFLDNCTTSGNGIMFMNYMDYSNDLCMNLFTAGQRGMMRASIFNARNSILSSPCEEESVLSIPLQLDLIVDENDFGNNLTWHLESQELVDTFVIKKGIVLDDLSFLDIVNDCEPNVDLYDCTYLDESKNRLSYYQIEAHLKNGEIVLSDVEVIKTHLDISAIIINPNPVDGILNLSNLNTDEIYQIEIFNNLGQHIWKDKVYKDETSKIDVHQFVNGIYYIKISANQEYTLKKIVKI